MADITQILVNTQNPDQTVRSQAEQQLEQAKEANFSLYLSSLAKELSDESKPSEVRRLAGLILKNSIDSRSYQTKKSLQQKWLNQVDQNQRMEIKSMIFQALSSPVQEIRHTAAQVVAKFAAAEIPAKQWPELIPQLQLSVSGPQSSTELKQSTLEALGYICEELSLNGEQGDDFGGMGGLDQTAVNTMLTAIIQGMDKTETNNEVRLAACNALSIALTFASENFSKQQERDYIMQVTCEATVSPDQRIRYAAFEVLVGVAEEYYEYLESYISAIYDLTVKVLHGDDPQIGLQAIEFWSSI